MLYLSTVEAGGRTIFPKISLSVKPEAGSLLYWHIRCISHCWVGEDWSDSSNVLSVLSLNHSLLTASGLRAISNMFESVHTITQPPNFHLDTLSLIVWRRSDGSMDSRMHHLGCPVLYGDKWIGNKWIRWHEQVPPFMIKGSAQKRQHFLRSFS